MDTVDLLYIAFVDLNEPANSGSSVRPQQMLHAFQKIGCSMKVLDGWHNKRKERRAHVKEVMRWLDTHQVRYCYVEPPSGPFFVREDLMLLKKLHKMGVPIGLFYRDIYWRFKSQYTKINPLKFFLIQCLQRRDLAVFKKTVSLFYFPTMQMVNIADFHVPFAILPPGADASELGSSDFSEMDRIHNAEVLTLFFVGGLSPRYGFDILLDAVKTINQKQLRLRLTVACRAQEWLDFQQRYAIEKWDWLTIRHVSFGDGLEELYQQVDFSVLPLRKNAYTDFAISVKLFEYAGYGKPVLCTDLEAMSQIVQENGLGWVCKDNAEDMARVLESIIVDRPSIIEKKENIKRFLPENTWEARAQEVLFTLGNLNGKNR